MKGLISLFFAALLALGSGLSCTRAIRPGQGTSSSDALRHADMSPELMPGYLLDVSVMVAGEKEVEVTNGRIQTDGMIELPLLGSVRAEGKTRHEFKEYIQRLYNESYFVDPQVSVDFVLDESDVYPWGHVTVLGCVSKPGRIQIPATRDLTITQAIQKAGGLEKFAKEKAIRIIRRKNGSSEPKIIVDFREIAAGGSKEDVLLYHGDVIYVPEVIF